VYDLARVVGDHLREPLDGLRLPQLDPSVAQRSEQPLAAKRRLLAQRGHGDAAEVLLALRGALGGPDLRRPVVRRSFSNPFAARTLLGPQALVDRGDDSVVAIERCPDLGHPLRSEPVDRARLLVGELGEILDGLDPSSA
jgi:hypothetical protein